MNKNSATKLIKEAGLELLRWNKSFTIATVRATDGQTRKLYIDGSRERMAKRLKQFDTALSVK